jgi:hypothetical protein
VKQSFTIQILAEGENFQAQEYVLTQEIRGAGSDRTSLIRLLKSSKRKNKKKNSFNLGAFMHTLLLKIPIQARISIEPAQNAAIRR